jgi:hypothetical protein
MVVAAAVAQEEEEEVPEAEDMALAVVDLAVVDLADLDLADQVGDVDGVRDGVLVGGVLVGGVLVGARARDIGDLPHQDYFGFAVALPTLIPLVNLKLLS